MRTNVKAWTVSTVAEITWMFLQIGKVWLVKSDWEVCAHREEESNFKLELVGNILCGNVSWACWAAPLNLKVSVWDMITKPQYHRVRIEGGWRLRPEACFAYNLIIQGLCLSPCVCMCKPVLYIKAVSASDIGLSALDGDEDVIFLNSFWAL